MKPTPRHSGPRKVWDGLNPTARMHLVLGVIWALMTIPTVIWWSESILWVCTMSIYAIVVGHWGAVEASRKDL